MSRIEELIAEEESIAEYDASVYGVLWKPTISEREAFRRDMRWMARAVVKEAEKIAIYENLTTMDLWELFEEPKGSQEGAK